MKLKETPFYKSHLIEEPTLPRNPFCTDFGTVDKINKYADTNILLAGHTDATGSDEHNYELSRRLAQSVADYLVTQNVNSVRIATEGYGKSQPIADNDTVEGRAQNRRVEVAIWANEKLKKVAKEKTS
jgi:hypothetical protein